MATIGLTALTKIMNFKKTAIVCSNAFVWLNNTKFVGRKKLILFIENTSSAHLAVHFAALSSLLPGKAAPPPPGALLLACTVM